MKLNNFFNKEPVPAPIRGREVINVNNEYREAKLQASINELNQEVARLTSLYNDYELLQKKHHVVEEQISDMQKEYDLLKEQDLRYKQDVLYYESKMKEISNLEQSILDIQNESNKFRDEFYSSKNVVSKQEGELVRLKNDNEELSTENKLLVDKAHTFEMQTQALINEFKEVKEKVEIIDKEYNELSIIYLEAKRNVSTLKDEKAYWENFAYSVQNQLEENTVLSTQLKDWLNVLDKDKTQANAQVTWGDVKITELETIITDMGKSLEDLLAEREYLKSLNDQLKYQLSKNSYASVGAIAKKEGFKMSIANSATNWNKNYLGNSRPTLLKFRAREE
jgi:chromosome segregation ATPase